jgi:hypothetical protein
VRALNFGDANAIGWYTPPEPASETDEAGYINNLIDRALNSGPTLVDGEYYTRTGNDFGALADATATGATKSTGENPSNTGIDATGYTYLIGKYNGPNGAGYVWYVAGLTIVDIPTKIDDSGLTVPIPGNKFGDALKGGLSHYTMFNPGNGVPDGGATLGLMGIALLSLSLMARRKA